jgi:hypothetical protein
MGRRLALLAAAWPDEETAKRNRLMLSDFEQGGRNCANEAAVVDEVAGVRDRPSSHLAPLR